MKVLSIGLDNSILDKDSSLCKRALEYGEIVEKYSIIVPSDRELGSSLNTKVSVFGSGGKNKVGQIFKIWDLANILFKKENFDIITVQDTYFIGLLAYFLKKKHKVGLELQIHGFEKYRGVRKLIANYIISKADSIRVVSERLGAQLVSEFGVDMDRVTVVPIYTKVESRKSKVESQKNDKVIFLYTGRFVAVKNLEMMIEAMASDELRKLNCELRLVGGGELSEELKLESRKLGVEKKVKFISWQDSLDDIYKKADCFLLVSSKEGWGLSVVEAASYALPAIMTDVGCAGELIIDGESGLVIPVGDEEALRRAMVRIVEDAELRKRLGENARIAVGKLPNKKETLDLYKESWEKAKL